MSDRISYLNLLYQITVQADEATTIEEPLEKAIQLICKTLHLPVGHAFAPVEDSPTTMQSTAIWYMNPPQQYEAFRAASEQVAFNPGLGGIRQVFMDRVPHWFKDVTQRSDFVRIEAARAVGLHTGIFIPVLSRQETVAILEFYSDQVLQPDEALLNIMAQIGLQLGRVIERKRADIVIHQREAWFRSLFESAPTGIVIIDQAGYIRMANDQTCAMFGYRQTELEGKRLEILLPERFRPVHDTHRQRYFAAPQPRAMGVDMDLVGLHKDGSEFPIEVGLSTISGYAERLAVGFISDITERKDAEERIHRMNAELEQRVKERTAHLAAVNMELEAFSYSVSHDLRAPLRAVDGFSQALLEDYYAILDDVGRDFLNRIRAESQRMGHLIDDLIALSRYTRATMEVSSVDLSAIVREIAAELQALEPDRNVELLVQENIIACADESLIRIALLNLINNAWKFTGKEQEARIEFGSVRRMDGVEYYLKDNGAGFDMAYVNKLFGAFQRLHAMDEFSGTGIGLATVQRIIHRHGGTIRAVGEVNKGAAFYFTLDNQGCG